MLAISPNRKARIQARIALIESQISTLETAISSALASHIEEYTFNSGDGSQRAVNRTTSEMQRTLDNLYRQLEFQYNLLRGRGIVKMVMARR